MQTEQNRVMAPCIHVLCRYNRYHHKCIYLQGDITLQKRKLKENLMMVVKFQCWKVNLVLKPAKEKPRTHKPFILRLTKVGLSKCLPPSCLPAAFNWLLKGKENVQLLREGEGENMQLWLYQLIIHRNCNLLLVPLKFFYCVSTMTIFNAVFQFIIMSSNFTITRSNNT